MTDPIVPPAPLSTLDDALKQLAAADARIAEQDNTIEALSKHSLQLQAKLEGDIVCPTCGTRCQVIP